MSKKFKLDLNKEAISNLQAKEITGGNETGICTIKSAQVPCGHPSFMYECDWSLAGNTDTPSAAGMC